MKCNAGEIVAASCQSEQREGQRSYFFFFYFYILGYNESNSENIKAPLCYVFLESRRITDETTQIILIFTLVTLHHVKYVPERSSLIKADRCQHLFPTESRSNEATTVSTECSVTTVSIVYMWNISDALFLGLIAPTFQKLETNV